MNRKPVPALIQTSYLFNEIKNRTPNSQKTILKGILYSIFKQQQKNYLWPGENCPDLQTAFYNNCDLCNSQATAF
jgi:hypothetical protein